MPGATGEFGRNGLIRVVIDGRVERSCAWMIDSISSNLWLSESADKRPQETNSDFESSRFNLSPTIRKNHSS